MRIATLVFLIAILLSLTLGGLCAGGILQCGPVPATPGKDTK